MKRRRRALGVILLRRHLRRSGFSLVDRLAAASAAIARPSSSASSRFSAMRAVASPPLRKLTQYSPGKRLSVSPRARSSRATTSKREIESVSAIYSACASIFRASTALIDSRRPAGWRIGAVVDRPGSCAIVPRGSATSRFEEADKGERGEEAAAIG